MATCYIHQGSWALGPTTHYKVYTSIKKFSRKSRLLSGILQANTSNCFQRGCHGNATEQLSASERNQLARERRVSSSSSHPTSSTLPSIPPLAHSESSSTPAQQRLSPRGGNTSNVSSQQLKSPRGNAAFQQTSPRDPPPKRNPLSEIVAQNVVVKNSSKASSTLSKFYSSGNNSSANNNPKRSKQQQSQQQPQLQRQLQQRRASSAPIAHTLTRGFSRSSNRNRPQSMQENCSLSDDEMNDIIWENEMSVSVETDIISHLDINQLASNIPNEDQIFATRTSADEQDLLVGILDGHGGHLFGQFVKERLPYYLHSALSDYSHLLACKNITDLDDMAEDLIEQTRERTHNEQDWMAALRLYIREVMQRKAVTMVEQPSIYSTYVTTPLRHLLGPSVLAEHTDCPSEQLTQDIAEGISQAFLRLDADITREIKMLAEDGKINKSNIGLPLSGCCALVAYITKDEMFVANSGDCRAVLGTCDERGRWGSVQLTDDHTANANPDEVRRILKDHPTEEQRTCIQYGRLLGRLAPLRALGDIQFKLESDELRQIFKILPKYKPLESLKTPPYLTCKPDVYHYKLEQRDRFVVLASDGLWDMLSNDEVVDIVAGFTEGRAVDMLKERAVMMNVANHEQLLNDPNAFQDVRNENVASFIIRFALNGYDKQNLQELLTIPYPEVRQYKDDISVTVLFFNQDGLVESTSSSASSSSEYVTARNDAVNR